MERLRVIDSSIMPSICGGNTTAPSYMIGEKGATMIREDWSLISKPAQTAPHLPFSQVGAGETAVDR